MNGWMDGKTKKQNEEERLWLLNVQGATPAAAAAATASSPTIRRLLMQMI